MEEEKQRNGVEEEEEDVELSDFPTNGIDLSFFVRDAAED